MKRVIFLLIFLILTLSFAGCGKAVNETVSYGDVTNDVEKDAPAPSEGLEFELIEDGSAYAVIGMGECKDSDLVIPSEHLGKPVVAVSGSFEKCDLKSVYIPGSVKRIDGEEAFDECKSLEKVTLNRGLTYIGTYAFKKSFSLNEIEIPDTVVEIGKGAFKGSGIKKLVVPGSVKIIGEGAFGGLGNALEITVSDGVEKIGREAFSTCKNLETLTLPASVKEIGETAFEDCKALRNIYYTGDAGQWCMIDFENEESNPISNFVKKGGLCFYLKGQMTVDVVIPDGTPEIKQYAFSGAYGIKSVTIPESVTKIGRHALCEFPLENIYYKGSEEQWKKIEIGQNDNFEGAKISFAK